MSIHALKAIPKYLDEDEFEDWTLEQIEQAFRDAAAPALQLVGTATPGLSKLGGQPDVPPGFEWPRDSKDRPLLFVAQIDVSAIPTGYLELTFPPAGVLYFFYTQDQYHAYYDPASRRDFRVIFFPTSADLSPASNPSGLDFAFWEKRVTFRQIRSIPSGSRLFEYGTPLDDGYEMVQALRKEAAHGEPQHQIGGFPDPIQGDIMELFSQLASNGICCGEGKDFETPRAKKLLPGAADWKLLLQLEDDPSAGMFWMGGIGLRVYFWIRAQDLAAGDVSNAWAVQQSS